MRRCVLVRVRILSVDANVTGPVKSTVIVALAVAVVVVVVDGCQSHFLRPDVVNRTPSHITFSRVCAHV